MKAALDAAVATATGLSGDRLARLRDAVKAAGQRTDDVRLVRVFGPEEPVTGAKTIGGFQYLVDHSPASMTQSQAPKKERGGRGGGGPGGAGAWWRRRRQGRAHERRLLDGLAPRRPQGQPRQRRAAGWWQAGRRGRTGGGRPK